eukprot:3449486-Alexandrium_andersonii.AAC.1
MIGIFDGARLVSFAGGAASSRSARGCAICRSATRGARRWVSAAGQPRAPRATAIVRRTTATCTTS